MTPNIKKTIKAAKTFTVSIATLAENLAEEMQTYFTKLAEGNPTPNPAPIVDGATAVYDAVVESRRLSTDIATLAGELTKDLEAYTAQLRGPERNLTHREYLKKVENLTSDLIIGLNIEKANAKGITQENRKDGSTHYRLRTVPGTMGVYTSRENVLKALDLYQAPLAGMDDKTIADRLSINAIDPAKMDLYKGRMDQILATAIKELDEAAKKTRRDQPTGHHNTYPTGQAPGNS